MNLDLVVCPGCRILRGDQLDVRTLQRAGDLLLCACGRRYPIVDGVPIVLADPAGFVRSEIATIIEADLAPEVTAVLAEVGPDDAPYPRLLEHLSIYLDAHWGDRATPPPEHAGFGLSALVDKIAARATDRVELAVELGCSVGRITAELAAGADHVVAVDLQFGAVRRARHLLAGEPVRYARREVGRHYQPAVTAAGDRAVPGDRITWLCSDALDPPLLPVAYDRVVALNVLDSVSRPRQLLSVVDVLCKRGGEVVLASPYAWQSSIVDDRQRLGGLDPALELTRLLREGDGLACRYLIEDEGDISWTLRRDGRSQVTYRTHYVRARKT